MLVKPPKIKHLSVFSTITNLIYASESDKLESDPINKCMELQTIEDITFFKKSNEDVINPRNMNIYNVSIHNHQHFIGVAQYNYHEQKCSPNVIPKHTDTSKPKRGKMQNNNIHIPCSDIEISKKLPDISNFLHNEMKYEKIPILAGIHKLDVKDPFIVNNHFDQTFKKCLEFNLLSKKYTVYANNTEINLILYVNFIIIYCKSNTYLDIMDILKLLSHCSRITSFLEILFVNDENITDNTFFLSMFNVDNCEKVRLIEQYKKNTHSLQYFYFKQTSMNSFDYQNFLVPYTLYSNFNNNEIEANKNLLQCNYYFYLEEYDTEGTIITFNYLNNGVLYYFHVIKLTKSSIEPDHQTSFGIEYRTNGKFSNMIGIIYPKITQNIYKIDENIIIESFFSVKPSSIIGTSIMFSFQAKLYLLRYIYFLLIEYANVGHLYFICVPSYYFECRTAGPYCFDHVNVDPVKDLCKPTISVNLEFYKQCITNIDTKHLSKRNKLLYDNLVERIKYSKWNCFEDVLFYTRFVDLPDTDKILKRLVKNFMIVENMPIINKNIYIDNIDNIKNKIKIFKAMRTTVFYNINVSESCIVVHGIKDNSYTTINVEIFKNDKYICVKDIIQIFFRCKTLMYIKYLSNLLMYVLDKEGGIFIEENQIYMINRRFVCTEKYEI